MKMLTTPKAKYLLEGGLEVLHSQSIEWLSEIEFWRDETAFLYAYILKKGTHSIPSRAKDIMHKIEKELIRLRGEELNELQEIVEKHEVYLGKIIEFSDEDEESYRDKHRTLTFKFHQLESRIKSLKKEVYNLTKMIHENELVE